MIRHAKDILVSIAAVFSLAACVNDPEGGVLLEIGDAMPWFEAVTLDGDTVTPESLAGDESVIVFFNTECSDCRRELPQIQHKADSEMPLGVRYICISREEGREKVERYWSENGFTMPVSPQTTRDIYSRFAKSGIPVTFRFDSNLRLISFDDSAQ